MPIQTHTFGARYSRARSGSVYSAMTTAICKNSWRIVCMHATWESSPCSYPRLYAFNVVLQIPSQKSNNWSDSVHIFFVRIKYCFLYKNIYIYCSCTFLFVFVVLFDADIPCTNTYICFSYLFCVCRMLLLISANFFCRRRYNAQQYTDAFSFRLWLLLLLVFVGFRWPRRSISIHSFLSFCFALLLSYAPHSTRHRRRFSSSFSSRQFIGLLFIIIVIKYTFSHFAIFVRVGFQLVSFIYRDSFYGIYIAVHRCNGDVCVCASVSSTRDSA